MKMSVTHRCHTCGCHCTMATPMPKQAPGHVKANNSPSQFGQTAETVKSVDKSPTLPTQHGQATCKACQDIHHTRTINSLAAQQQPVRAHQRANTAAAKAQHSSAKCIGHASTTCSVDCITMQPMPTQLAPPQAAYTRVCSMLQATTATGCPRHKRNTAWYCPYCLELTALPVLPVLTDARACCWC